jgi:outer membrane biogenesis lipoprotein LolB
VKTPGGHLPVVATAVALVLAACTRSPLELPAEPGKPFPGYAEAFRQAVATCEGVRTWSAEIALSGRSGTEKLRGRLLAGLAPGALRLVATAPFGQPAFVLVAHDGVATLLLPRDRRVLRDAAPAEVVEALAGVALDPNALRALVSGCLTPDRTPAGGMSYPKGWFSVDLDHDESRAFLRKDGETWQIVAGVLPGLSVEYGEFRQGTPRWVRLRTTAAAGTGADLTLAVSQVDINVPAEGWFTVSVPHDYTPLTLDELRAAGPLGAAGGEKPEGGRQRTK